MRSPVFRVGVGALILSAVACQGCLVPWSKYIKLKREYDQLAREMERKDTIISDDQTRIEQLKNQLTSKDQIVGLYDAKAKDAAAAVQRSREELAKLEARLNKAAGGQEGVIVGKDGTITLKDTLLFPLGSAEISEKGQKVIQDIAKEFQGTNEVIQIDGHTDDHRVSRPETVQRYTDNWGLSAARGCAVLRLLAKSGIPENRIYVRAFSMFRPRTPNATEDARSQNRRVEILFLPPGFGAQKAVEPVAGPEPAAEPKPEPKEQPKEAPKKTE